MLRYYAEGADWTLSLSSRPLNSFELSTFAAGFLMMRKRSRATATAPNITPMISIRIL